jgi:hypothetical protein
VECASGERRPQQAQKKEKVEMENGAIISNNTFGKQKNKDSKEGSTARGGESSRKCSLAEAYVSYIRWMDSALMSFDSLSTSQSI